MDKKPVNDYVRYSGIGFQMLFIILGGVYLGHKIDQWTHIKYPIFTLVLTLVSVGLAMYVVIREAGQKNK